MAGRNRKINDLVSSRVGFHYFSDSSHYSSRHLATWLPVLQHLHASWLVLDADATRAIPEQFITGLVSNGISPIIHLRMPLPNSPSASELRSILAAYSRWGVQHIIFFDRPNLAQSWSAAGWIQQDLVERFVDRFLPLAASALQLGIKPIFPPLEPGGSYWDLSFLKQSLQSIQRRGYTKLVSQMGIASFAYTFNHELDYGAGGPARWPNTLPYGKSSGSEDQRGFHNYEWLQSSVISAFGDELAVFMLGAGIKEPGVSYSPEVHAGICLNILEHLKTNGAKNALPDYVKCANFYTLAADPGTPAYAQAWFKQNGEVLPIVELLFPPQSSDQGVYPWENVTNISNGEKDLRQISDHPIDHYLLLPLYEWGIAEFHLEVIRPYLQKYHPTLGFSIEEAALAKKVTVIGGEQTFPEEFLSSMRANGAVVDRISGDGTSIATQLAER